MFESDDYDEVLSGIDLPDFAEIKSNTLNTSECVDNSKIQDVKLLETKENINVTNDTVTRFSTTCSPKHTKRKIINSHFDHKNKRKFPGPAGLLTGLMNESKDETIYQIELLSQDIDYSYNTLNDIHETPLWKRLEEDTKDLKGINTIKAIKSQALAGHLRSKKAQIVLAFVEAIDRSGVDPLITLRDATGHIKCTLHRDAWSQFSAYIVSKYCALILYKPTVLTTGSAFKKHYLNITLSNISAIYSSTVISDNEQLPNGFLKTCEEDYTILKTERNISGVNSSPENDSLQDDLQFLQDDLEDVFADAF